MDGWMDGWMDGYAPHWTVTMWTNLLVTKNASAYAARTPHNLDQIAVAPDAGGVPPIYRGGVLARLDGAIESKLRGACACSLVEGIGGGTAPPLWPKPVLGAPPSAPPAARRAAAASSCSIILASHSGFCCLTMMWSTAFTSRSTPTTIVVHSGELLSEALPHINIPRLLRPNIMSPRRQRGAPKSGAVQVKAWQR